MKQVKKIKKVKSTSKENKVKEVVASIGIVGLLSKVDWKKAYSYFVALIKGKKLDSHTILHAVWGTVAFLLFNANVEQTEINTELQTKVDSTQIVVQEVTAKADSLIITADSVVSAVDSMLQAQAILVWRDSKGTIHIGQ